MTGDAPVRKPRIAILSPTPLTRSPRALKQVRALGNDYEIVTASRGSSPFAHVEHVQLPDREQRWGIAGRLLYLVALVLRLYPLITHLSAQDHAIRVAFSDREWDLVIAHDVQTATVAEHLRPRRGVVVDLHEYAPRQNEHSLAWRLMIAPYFHWILSGTIRRAVATSTISAGIVEEYTREYGFEPTLIINASPYQEREATPVHSPLRLVHSGVAAPHRHVEILIDAVRASTSHLTLDLYLVGLDSEYGRILRQRAASDHRIRLHQPVPYDTLVATLAEHDLGLHVLPPINFNHLHALPNKLFDYVQARLGVVIGPSPEMARIVRESGVGVVTEGFTAESLRAAIDALTPAMVAEYKAASARSAHALSSERQTEIFLEMVSRVLA